jgi:hypothetical protein
MNFFRKSEPHQLALTQKVLAENASPEGEALRLELVAAFKSGSGMRAVAELVLKREAKMAARITELESLVRDAHALLMRSKAFLHAINLCGTSSE